MLMQTLDDAAVIALIPGLVLMLRRTGLPARLETAAMVAGGVLLVALADLAAAGLTRLAPPRGSTPSRPTPDHDAGQNIGLR